MFYRQILEDRGLNVSEAQRICIDYVASPRHYRFLRGERIPDSQELKWMEKRLNFNTPVEVLSQEDNKGRPVKSVQFTLPHLKEVKR